ncbi:MAG: nitrate- and nitrite sensing domain-containing protein [Candidatus Marithrix sp.]
MLKNIKTTNKLAFMLAIPMIGLIYLATTITFAKLDVVRQMNMLQNFSEITVKASALIHELQKERGLSAGLISSNGSKLFPTLQKQRLKTNNAKQELDQFLINLGTDDIRNKFQEVLDKEDNIINIRSSIDNFNISLQQQINYYNELIDMILTDINHIAKAIVNNEFTHKIMAYVYLLQAKEKAGIERAIVYAALTQSYFDFNLHKKILALIEAQDIYTKNFLLFATDTQQQFYKNTRQGKFIDELKHIREYFLIVNFNLPKYVDNNKIKNMFQFNKPALHYETLQSHILEIEPSYWWEMATGNINLLKKVENKISFDLQQSAIKFKQNAQIVFAGYLIFTGCIILFTFFYARIVLQKTNQAYSRFVPNELLHLLSKKDILDIQLGEQVELNMTVLFSDIRSFTSLSEKMSAQENFDFINAYLSEIIPIIHINNGIIDKYIGDAIMALFINADDAVNAAINMVKTQKHQGIEAGIGLNTGNLMLGIIGEENRLQCTVISDTVNVASRLETITKIYKVPFIISQSTFNSLADASLYNYRFIDNIKVKGRFEHLNIFEIFNSDEKSIQDKKLANLESFKTAINLYQHNKFVETETIMQQVLQTNPCDTVAKLFIHRCEKFLNTKNIELWEDLIKKADWIPDLAIHHTTIDSQHQELFIRMKSLMLSISKNQSYKDIVELIQFLKNYAIVHFSTEETYMRQNNYSFYTVHKNQHEKFMDNLQSIIDYYENNGSNLYLTLRIKEELIEWFIKHINNHDRQLGIFLTH